MTTRAPTTSKSGPALGRASALLLAVTVIFALRLLHGCGGGAGSATDAGPTIADGGNVVTVNCDPAAQTGCGADEKCDLFCGAAGPEYGCRKNEGTLATGQACKPTTTTGAQTCVKGTTCVATIRGTVCTTLCADDTVCGAGKCVTSQAVFACFPDPTKNKPFAVSTCQ